MNRIDREKKVVGLMIAVYCRKNHGCADGLCDECRGLLDYARQRLDRCPKGNAKPSCRLCEIHCYSPSQRESIRAVMRFAGPRMLFAHPLAAIWHLYKELR